MKKFIKQDVPPGFEHEKKNIAVDFDGVVHEFHGWGDGTCYGEPIEGSIEAIKKMSEEYNVIIFSAKVRPDRPIVNGKTGTELVTEWLNKHDLLQYITDITHEKPRAKFYIDDKAVYFNNNWGDILDLVI